MASMDIADQSGHLGDWVRNQNFNNTYGAAPMNPNAWMTGG
jgi:hypothetical protein